MEADYGLKCSDANGKFEPEYAAYHPWVWVAAVAYALGVPLCFRVLVRRYAADGKAGDKVVETALGTLNARSSTHVTEDAGA